LDKKLIPQLISEPFQQGLRLAFADPTVLAMLAALASWLRGQRVIYGQDAEAIKGVEVGPLAA
jgi:hypothetical protein